MVDDPVVVVENIYRRFEIGQTVKIRIIDGTAEVVLPVTSAALNFHDSDFLPMLLMTVTLPGRLLCLHSQNSHLRPHCFADRGFVHPADSFFRLGPKNRLPKNTMPLTITPSPCA